MPYLSENVCCMQQTPAARLAESYSALERKAKLYDKLASGQHDDEDDLYNVDFVRKGTLDDERREMGPDVSRDTASHAAIDTAATATRRGGTLLSFCCAQQCWGPDSFLHARVITQCVQSS
jgi:hypothetical protein